MGLKDHYKVQYSEAVTEIAGHQNRSILKELVEREAKTGDIVTFDTIEPKDEATLTAIDSLTDQYKEYFDQLSAGAFADFLKMQTPHMAIDKGRVQLSAFENLWAHSFRKMDEVRENGNDQSRTLKMGMKKIFKNQDKVILDALFAATVTKGQDAATVANVAFPVGQQLNEADGVFDLETISAIRRIYKNNELEDEQLICVISAEVEEMLINNSGGTIENKDFVDSAEYFKNGKLPMIRGVSFLVRPAVNNYKGAYNHAFAVFTPSSVVYNQFEMLETQIEKAPTQKFNVILQICEFINAVRRDDKGIIQGTLGTV
tara:strand:+ start:1997 stop:2944 length:948 start_codon:yes stop_codon:yes gene_type:complete